MKKILSIITSAILCFSSFSAINAGAAALAPVDSFTAENKTADSGSCGVSVTWSYSNGKLTFTGSGAMSSWETATATPWYKYSSQITSVEIAQGITNIGAASFANVQNLSSINIPDSITKVEFGAFDSCKSLSSIDLPAKVATIGRNAFKSCSSLRSITIRNINCYIVGGNDTICNSAANSRSTFSGTIIGYNNSTAQTYATECSYKFVSLGNAPVTTTTTKATTTTTKKTTTTAKPTTTTTARPVVTTTTTNVKPQPPENNTFESVKDGMLTYKVYKDHAELEKCERFMWGELNIPNDKNGVPVTVICEGALRDRMFVSGAVLSENVHTIAANSFTNSGCKNVTINDPDCNIADNCGIKCQITAYDGSTAQAYAQKNGLAFVSLGPAPSHAAVSDLMAGDANCDKNVDLADAVLIMQSYSNPNKYGLNGYDQAHITEKGIKNGDVDGGGNGITPKDAAAIQRYLLGVIKEF